MTLTFKYIGVKHVTFISQFQNLMKPGNTSKVQVFQTCIYVQNLSKCAELHYTSTTQMEQHDKNTQRGKVSELGQIFTTAMCGWSGFGRGRDSSV